MQVVCDPVVNTTTEDEMYSQNTSTSSTISASTKNISDHMPDMITKRSKFVDTNTEYMDDDSALDITSATYTYVLAEKFPITHFTEFQKQAIDAALDGKDTLIIQPTGQGKSLCYQFPAMCTGKTTLVILHLLSVCDYTIMKGTKVLTLGAGR